MESKLENVSRVIFEKVRVFGLLRAPLRLVEKRIFNALKRELSDFLVACKGFVRGVYLENEVKGLKVLGIER